MHIEWPLVMGLIAFYLLWCALEAVYNSWVDRSWAALPRHFWNSLKSVKPTWKKKK